MKIHQIALFEELSDCQNVMLAGAGGGFDVYGSIPLFFALRELGKTVYLANLSFASLRDKQALMWDCCFRVTKDTAGSDTYFPERTLCRWLHQTEGIEAAVYSFPQSGVVPLKNAYQNLADHLELDAIVLVDGGTDSLMRGDEAGLGTPSEDLSSMVAVNRTDVSKKLLACIGFGVDRFHGVCHAQFLEAVAALTEQRAFLGAFSVLPQSVEAQKYLDLVQYASAETITRPSIVNTSIASSVAGKFGDYHSTTRTEGSQLWISPLMSMYWSFQLPAVVERNLYADRIEDTESFHEVTETIQQFRAEHPRREWEAIPD